VLVVVAEVQALLHQEVQVVMQVQVQVQQVQQVVEVVVVEHHKV
jgi:hypothetical protein